MSVDMLGAIIPKDISICLVVQEIARQIDHFTFGLWRVCFPPCLVRPGRRLPVQGLSEGSLGFLVSLTGYPRNGAPGPG